MSTPGYLSFPLRMQGDRPGQCDTAQHVREIIAQVLFTAPRERVFRPAFGAGARQLVFEPNDLPLREQTRQRIAAALEDALRGEVDPQTLEIEVEGAGAELVITVRYVLGGVGRAAAERFAVREA